MPKDIVFWQKVSHRSTCGDVRQKPEPVLQVRQKPHIRIGERRPRARLQAFDGLRQVLASDNIQPFLYVALVLELRAFARAGGRKEFVEIELVELAGARDRQEFVRHLVGEKTHLRQRAIRVPLAWDS